MTQKILRFLFVVFFLITLQAQAQTTDSAAMVKTQQRIESDLKDANKHQKKIDKSQRKIEKQQAKIKRQERRRERKMEKVRKDIKKVETTKQ